MKKFYGILVVLIIAFFTPFMVACNPTTPPEAQVTLVEIDIADRELNLEVGDTYQLRYVVLPDEVENDKKGVRFESDNPAVTVTDSGLVRAVEPTSTPAIIKIFSTSNPSAYNASTATVTVVAEKTNLPAPTGLYFDYNTNQLKWNKLNYPNFEERYALSLTADGEDEEVVTLSTNVYSDYDAGKHYTAKVKYLGGVSSIYNDSEYSQPITFQKLATPVLALTPSESVSGVGVAPVDARTWTISFHTVNDAPILDEGNKLANYNINLSYSNVDIDVAPADLTLWNTALQQAQITGNADTGWDVVITIPDGLSNNDYRVTIQAIGNTSTEGDIFDSATSYVDFDKLATPSNMIISGENMLTWNNVQNARYYKIVYYYKSNFGGTAEFNEDAEYIAVGANMHYIPSRILDNSSDLYVYMYAIGDNQNLIDSSISPYCARTKLAQVNTLTLLDRSASNDLVLNWSAVPNAGSYRVTVTQNGSILYNYSQQAVPLNNTHTIALDALGNNGQKLFVGGEYNIAVTALPESTISHIASDISESITVTKLSMPQIRVSEGKLVWDASNITDDTIKYDLSIQNVGDDSSLIKDFGTIKLGSDIQEYSLTGGDYTGYAGKFNISITTRGGEDKNIIDSTRNNITITKIPTPEVLKISNGEIQSVNANYCYSLIVKQQQTEGGNYVDYGESQYFDSDGMNAVRNYLHEELTPGYAYSLSLIGVGLKNAGPSENYIYSEISPALAVRFLANPRIGLSNGVLTITKPNDPYIFEGQKLKENYQLHYQVRVGTQTTTTDVSAMTTDDNVADTVSLVLPDLAGTTTVYVRAVVTYTGEPQDFTMLNSEYVNSGRVTILNRVDGVRLDSNVLSWNAINNANGYKISIVNQKGESVADAVTEVVRTNSIQLDETKLGTTGSYSITITAIGNNVSYITSYPSSECKITRLSAPTPSVQDGKLVWSSVRDANDNIIQKYALYYRSVTSQTTFSTEITGFETTLESLSAGKYDNIYVIALAEGLQNTLDSSVSEAQHNSNGLEIEKLQEIDINSITTTSGGVAWARTNYVKNEESSQDYSIKLSKIDSNGSKNEIRNTTVNETAARYSYVLPSNYGGGEYRISVTTLGSANQINSKPVEIIVFMLEPVTSIKIEEDKSDNISKLYANTLDNTSMPGYSTASETGNLLNVDNGDIRYSLTLYSNTNANNDTIETKLAQGEISNETGIQLSSLYNTVDKNANNYLAPGSIVNVTIVSQVIDSGEKTGNRIKDYNGTKCFILDSPSSELYQFRLLEAPSISINDSGLLSWGTNSANSSVKISFHEVDGDVINSTAIFTKEFNNTISSYDLSGSGLVAGKNYVVKTQAIGNGRDKQSSDVFENTVLIHKLPTINSGVDGWYVEDGKITWNQVSGASEYILYYTPEGGRVYTYTIAHNSSQGTTYSYLPNVSAGKVSIQFAVKGQISQDTITINDKEYTIGYLNSEKSTAKDVTKLGKASLVVKNGELTWNKITNASVYELTIGTSKIEQTQQDDDEQTFILSEKYETEGNYSVRLYAKGNSETDLDNKTAYLNGEYSNTKTVILYSATTLSITDGLLSWDNTPAHYGLQYELELRSNDGFEYINLNSKKTDLSNENYVGKTFTTISVRFKGGNSSATDSTIVPVNSGYSNVLQNVQKLDNVKGQFATINTDGKVEWSYDGIYGNAQPKTSITSYLSINGQTSEKYNEIKDYSSQMVYDLSASVKDLVVYGSYSYTPKVVMDLYALGTTDSASATGTLYLNSNVATFTTYKFNAIQDFVSDDITVANAPAVNLNLSWNGESAGVNTESGVIYPNQIIMRYKKSSDTAWTTKIFESNNIQEICYTPQFFEAGEYQFQMYAFDSSKAFLPSDSSYINGGDITTIVPFLAFAKGTGAIDNPFTISTKTQFLYINYLKTSYFELVNSIDMGTQVVSEYSHNLPRILSDIGRHSEFTGGLNGNGYRLYNITYNNALELSLFDTIRGTEINNVPTNNFYNKSGIVLNLTLDVAKLHCMLLNDTTSTQSAFDNNYGLLVQNNFGYIYNCHTKSSITSGNMSIKMQDDIVLAGIAGTNAQTKDGKGGIIDHCTNGINFYAVEYSKFNITENTEVEFNKNSKIAGIVAYNMGGSIISSHNYANITAGTLGGITYYNRFIIYKDDGSIELNNVGAVEGKTPSNSIVVGCTNQGNLTSITSELSDDNDDTWFPMGGIVATNTLGIISHCHNINELKVLLRDEDYTWHIMVGGIVGIMNSGDIYNSYTTAKTIPLYPLDLNGDKFTSVELEGVMLVSAEFACFIGDYDSDKAFNIYNIVFNENTTQIAYYSKSQGKPMAVGTQGNIQASSDTEKMKDKLNTQIYSSNFTLPTDYLDNKVYWYVNNGTVAVAYGNVSINTVTGGSVVAIPSGDAYTLQVFVDTGYQLDKIEYTTSTDNTSKELTASNSVYIISGNDSHIFVTPIFSKIDYTITNNNSDTLAIYINSEASTANSCYYDDLITISIKEGQTINNLYYSYTVDGQDIVVEIPLQNGVYKFRMPAQNITIYTK